MLNRRILRIKAFKALYTYAEDPSLSLAEVEAELGKSCEEVRNLYVYMLAIISPLTQEAKSRKGTRFTKFEENSIAPILDEDPDFQKLIKKLKYSWSGYDVLLHNLYDSIISKDYFKEYVAKEGASIKDDAALFVKIFEEEFVDNEPLAEILEDMSIYWNDDLAYALTYCCKAMEDIARTGRWNLPPLYYSELIADRDPQSDSRFVRNLVRHAYSHFAEYSDMIAASSQKWDKERLFVTDQVLVVTGLAEAATFPEIPVKVTINEFVEISKYYGTPKSRSFVNGVLDKLIKDLIESNKITKNQ